MKRSCRRHGVFLAAAAAATSVVASGLVGFSVVPAVAVATQTLHVSPTGSSSSGCEELTPCNLTRAQLRVRELNDSMAGDIIVELAGGTYRRTVPLSFTSEDSGIDSAKVVRWKAAPNANAVISGGTAIDANWTNTSGIYSASLPDAALNSRQLYVRGTRADRQSDAKSTLGTWKQTGAGYEVSSTAPQSWANPTDVEFVYDGSGGAAAGWTASRCRVAAVSAIIGGGSLITMAQPCYTNGRLPGSTTWPNLGTPTAIESAGAGSTLDVGEWYLDRTAKKVYYRPRTGDNLTLGGSQVELATSDGLVTATGLKFVQFSGLTFEYATWSGASDPAGVVDIQANLLTTDSSTEPDLKVDDRNAAVATAGSGWTSQTGANGQYGDSQTFTTVNSASLTFTFNGTGFEYVSTMASNRGAFTYSVDGGALQTGTCNQAIAADQQVCLSLAGLSAGNHTVTITKTGGTYLSFDAYRVINGSTTTTFDDNRTTYSKNAGGEDWTSQTGIGGQHLGTQTYATRTGASFSHTFTGTGLDYISTKAPNRGAFTYAITGSTTRSGSGTCYAASVSDQQACLSIRDLPYGQHTITFTKTDGTYMSVDALIKRAPRTVQLPSAVGFHASSNITFEGNTLRHLGGAGVAMDDGSTNGTVNANVITDISAGGITIGAGTYHPANANTYAPPRFVEDNAKVIDNYVADTGQEFRGAAAIAAGWVKNTTISHNDVIRAPYSGIVLGWGWGNTDQVPVQVNNHVDYNYVRDVMQSSLHDGGGIYVNGLEQASPRSSIIGNYVNGVPKTYGAIYLDNGASHFDVNNNVITNAPEPHGAIFLTSGGWGNPNTRSFGNTVSLNYGSTTTRSVYNPGGANNTIAGDNSWNLSTWPAAAKAIISAAGANLARDMTGQGGNATSSATATSQWSGSFAPDRAIDDNEGTLYSSNADGVGDDWKLDLGSQRAVSLAQIVYRSDGYDYVSDRQNLAVWVSNDPTMATKTVACIIGTTNAEPYHGSITCPLPPGTWQYVWVHKTDTAGLTFSELRILGHH